MTVCFAAAVWFALYIPDCLSSKSRNACAVLSSLAAITQRASKFALQRDATGGDGAFSAFPGVQECSTLVKPAPDLPSDGVHAVVVKQLLRAADAGAVDHQIVAGKLLQAVQSSRVEVAASLSNRRDGGGCTGQGRISKQCVAE